MRPVESDNGERPAKSITAAGPAMWGTPRSYPVVVHGAWFCHSYEMEQRISLVTLGVSDLARARTFYEALGW